MMFSKSSTDQNDTRNVRILRHLMLILLACVISTTLGCNGCSNNSAKKAVKKKTKEEKEKEKKKKQKPFDKRSAIFLPGVNEDSLTNNRHKPGHWANVLVPTVSNRENYDGILEATPVGVSGRPLLLSNSSYYLKTRRPVSLPKEQWKNLESMVYLPRRKAGSVNRVGFDFSLRGRGGGSAFSELSASILLKDYQFHLGVLTTRPGAYKYVEFIDSTKLPEDDSAEARKEVFYHVFATQKDQQVLLPSHSLAWTTIAYLLWDDLDPQSLTPEQKSAMIDWLHWGGQLIVSGPDGLEKLSNSFLAEYLPATVKSTVNLTADDFSQLNENWSIPKREPANEKHELSVPVDAKILGCRFDVADGATSIESTGGLVVEKSVGRGRITATAFSLDDRFLLRWKSLGGFFETCLLRRPAREFWQNAETVQVFMKWADGGPIFDPLLGSNLRYLSRDLGADGSPKKFVPVLEGDDDEIPQNQFFQRGTTAVYSTPVDYSRNLKNQMAYGGYEGSAGAGVAGWNDHGGVGDSARHILGSAAGIKPPSRDFVFRMLLIYLAALVPANWLFFKLIGRVEWAWLMAPLISIIGAVAVAKFASLDIGFVRSSTTVSVLELHGGYGRGHLTSYTSLYTSLSTNYDVEFDDSQSLVLPFSRSLDFVPPTDATSQRVQIDLGRNIRFEDFQIQSNTSERYHSETMLDTGGGISLLPTDNAWQLVNRSEIQLKDAAIIRRDPDKGLGVFWVGDAAAGATIDNVKFKYASEYVNQDSLREVWAESPVMFSPVRRAGILISRAISADPSTSKDSILFREILNVIESDSRFGTRDEYIDAARRCSTIGVNEKQAIEDLAISREQLIEVCDLANDKEAFKLGRLLDLFVGKLDLLPGETRLIGWSGQTIDRATIRPSATRTNQRTIIVVHLSRGKLPAPVRENQVYSDYSKFDFEDLFPDEDDMGEGGN